MNDARRVQRCRSARTTFLLPLLLVLTACPRSPSVSVPRGSDSHCRGSAGAAANAFGPENDLYHDSEVGAWPREGGPESAGFDAKALAAIGEDVALSSTVSSLLVARHGRLVYERYFNGAKRSDARHLYSAAKSIVSLLTGIAIERGEIPDVDTPISKLLPPRLASEPGAAGVTVRHLLTMSSGLESEDGRPDAFDRVGEQSKRVRAILREPHTFRPGAQFGYSTLSTYLLGAVLAHASGRSLCDLAQARLLSPIGATMDYAHSDPEGYFSGFFFMTPIELARLGQLVLDGGSWDGRQVVPSAWITQSMAIRWDLGCRALDREGYGYLWWRSEIAGFDAWQASGAGGQTITIVPGLDLVVVATHSNEYPKQADVVPDRRLVRRVMAALVRPKVDARVAGCPSRNVHRVRVDGSNERLLVDDAALDVAFDWSPDGSRILFASDRALNVELYSMAADGSDVRRLTRDFATEVFPSWSPDGGTIAFSSDEAGSEDIYLMDADGSDRRLLAGFDDADEQAATWSPDGRRIAFTSGDRYSGLGTLWVVAADGSGARILLDRRVRFPQWSPDGAFIAFDADVGGRSHSWALNVLTKSVVDLGLGIGPSWSPDGSRLAVALPGDVPAIDIIDVATRAHTRLAVPYAGVPLWSPDGKWLAVTA